MVSRNIAPFAWCRRQTNRAQLLSKHETFTWNIKMRLLFIMVNKYLSKSVGRIYWPRISLQLCVTSCLALASMQLCFMHSDQMLIVRVHWWIMLPIRRGLAGIHTNINKPFDFRELEVWLWAVAPTNNENLMGLCHGPRELARELAALGLNSILTVHINMLMQLWEERECSYGRGMPQRWSSPTREKQK